MIVAGTLEGPQKSDASTLLCELAYLFHYSKMHVPVDVNALPQAGLISFFCPSLVSPVLHKFSGTFFTAKYVQSGTLEETVTLAPSGLLTICVALGPEGIRLNVNKDRLRVIRNGRLSVICAVGSILRPDSKVLKRVYKRLQKRARSEGSGKRFRSLLKL